MKRRLIIILICVGVALAFIFLRKNPSSDPVPQQSVKVDENITISKKKISEENFTGERPVIGGTSILATTAQKYVDDVISEFRTRADSEVPQMREDFGAGSPPSTYTIEIGANYIQSEKTQSLVITEYTYTGGANGMSSYKVYTASRVDGHLMPLTEIIVKNKQAAFLSFVKKQLLAWRPEGMEETVVFKEDVEKLTFNDLQNWSLDADNLTLYFDKYSVGPGALGSIAFPFPRGIAKDFLVQ
jgi:hypothetical protein